MSKVRDDGYIENPSGARRSDRTGKGRYDLISPFGLHELALVCEEGALHKGERNWEKGFEMSRCLDSASRHINQYRMGMRDERHLAQACWNLFAAIHFEKMIRLGKIDEKFNDLPNYIDDLPKLPQQ
jgi:hypothetical protein